MDKPMGKYAWTAKVGEKGQIVIPKEAREVFGIRPGDTLLVLGDIERGLALVKMTRSCNSRRRSSTRRTPRRSPNECHRNRGTDEDVRLPGRRWTR